MGKNDVMLDVISQMKRAQIGHPKKWQKIARKVSTNVPLSIAETAYYEKLTRIYKSPREARRIHGSYHIKLSDADDGLRCAVCTESARYYCHMNDQYFCQVHIVGHDPNE